ncbi:lipid II:glycine glycyltransferase FemX [Primorskyibacter flagellatus]|uniref:Acetyltransferase (GNAT) domain-containing protein n=1 Tax=Primorskyibacter flagellatus TaxID=1387277 RepID=A0A1W1Z4A1_9RHOB|nr:GNAT family N-acetyltransferase [Primorskyibacter flagellatus]SMC42921.1 Acetyltransferase (GNAT) domain-containing protein [Primorskyibacter flagellatus]
METDFPASLALPLQQSLHYARALDLLGLRAESLAIRKDGAPIGWCLTQTRRLPLLGDVRMVTRGPVWKNAHADAALDWLVRWRRDNRAGPLLLNADGMAFDALRNDGFWPLITGATVAMLALSTPDEMRSRLTQKWRNRLVRAENGPLSVRSQNFDGDPADWLLAADKMQQRRRGYSGLPPAFTTAFARSNPRSARVFTACQKNEPVAAVLILRHGRMATYHIGHTLPEGRKCNAHNLLMWRAMTWLAKNGHDLLDLGTVNTQDAPGIARFKLGTGANAKHLGGTWLHLPGLAPFARRLPARMAA